jgi:predicted Zn-dependent protease
MEQLIFEFASLSSCPTNCTDLLRNARELYGEMLLDRGMAKEALAAFEATKAKEPNRFRGFLGAAQAAEKLGDKTAAKANYESFSRSRPARTLTGRSSPPPASL